MVRVNSTNKETSSNFSPENGTGAQVRQAIKDIFEALRTVNSGTNDPTGSANLAPYQMHINTTNESSGEAILKIRNGSNNAFVEIGNVLDTNLGLLPRTGGTSAPMTGQFLADDGGTASAPAIAFNGDPDTGLFKSATNQIGIVTSASERWKINSSGVFLWADHIQSLSSGANSSGVIVPKGIASKTGSNANATTSGHVYNFYWTGSALKCWIDEADQGAVSITSSDYRIKKNITTQTELGIDKIKQLRPVNYEYTDYGVFKGDGIAREGFVAHEVSEIIPSAVNDEKDGDAIQSLNLDAIVSVLTKALQEAVAKIETLEAKVAALEAK